MTIVGHPFPYSDSSGAVAGIYTTPASSNATIGLSCPDVASELAKMNDNLAKLVDALERLVAKDKV